MAPKEEVKAIRPPADHYHAQTRNGAELARAFGVAESTVKRYLDLLTAALVVRQLPPWHENISKRQLRSPKVYLRDSGLLHRLLGIGGFDELQSHPKVGASWEGFALEQILHSHDVSADNAYFWGTHAGAELDLLVLRGTQRWGFEIKRSSAPRMSRSLHVAISDLGLTRASIVYPGTQRYALAEKVEAVPLAELL